MTAARADRVSFGCSEEADFTYFGDALFAQALNQTDDLKQAFELARASVAEREQGKVSKPPSRSSGRRQRCLSTGSACAGNRPKSLANAHRPTGEQAKPGTH
jgi:hypothetical protein